MLDAALQQTVKKIRQVPPLSGISPYAGYVTLRRGVYGAFCTFLASLTFFIPCIIRTVYMVVFELHSFPLKLSGNRKYGKQLLPHETGTTSSTIW